MRIKHVVQGPCESVTKPFLFQHQKLTQFHSPSVFPWKPDEYGRSRCYLATELMGKLTHAWSIESGRGVQCMTSQ